MTPILAFVFLPPGAFMLLFVVLFAASGVGSALLSAHEATRQRPVITP